MFFFSGAPSDADLGLHIGEMADGRKVVYARPSLTVGWPAPALVACGYGPEAVDGQGRIPAALAMSSAAPEDAAEMRALWRAVPWRARAWLFVREAPVRARHWVWRVRKLALLWLRRLA